MAAESKTKHYVNVFLRYFVLILVAKLMEYLLCRFERLTYWAIFGLLAASPVAILGKIPLRGTSPAVIAWGVILFSVGAVVTGLLAGEA